MSLRLINWNVEWATPGSRKTAGILNRIDRHSPGIVCLTETHAGLLSRDGHTICSQPDYGYPVTEGRRKVILWSREPWERTDDLGIDSLPSGRFVSGVTGTSAGEHNQNERAERGRGASGPRPAFHPYGEKGISTVIKEYIFMVPAFFRHACVGHVGVSDGFALGRNWASSFSLRTR